MWVCLCACCHFARTCVLQCNANLDVSIFLCTFAHVCDVSPQQQFARTHNCRPQELSLCATACLLTILVLFAKSLCFVSVVALRRPAPCTQVRPVESVCEPCTSGLIVALPFVWVGQALLCCAQAVREGHVCSCAHGSFASYFESVAE